MATIDPVAQAAALVSLSNAYQAADAAYMAAYGANAAAPELPSLQAARNHALIAYLTATKESLVNNSSFTKQIKQQLDAATTSINGQLTTLKNTAQWLTLVTNLVNLAGSLASAFA